MRTGSGVVALLVCASALRADDWPQWLGPQRDGVWREAGVLDRFPAGGPKQVWTHPIHAGYAGPAVANGRVYVADRVTADGKMFSKEGTERLLCLDEKTGAEVWKHEYPADYLKLSYPSGPRTTATVDGDRVYFLGAVGDLVCLDAAKGTVLWSKNFPKDYAAKIPIWGYAAHPLVDGDKLICLGGGPDRLVVAFDKKTGKELWAKESAPEDVGYCPPMIYTFGGRRQLVIWHGKAVLGLDPETGSRIWKQDFESRYALTAPTPRQVGDDGLFVTSFYNGSLFLKVAADSAQVVWKSQTRGERPNQTTDLNSIIPTPQIDGDYAYGVCSYGQLRCLEVRTGKRVWETMRATRGKLTPPKVAENPEPADGERWSNAFLVRHADRYFAFNEQGDLIIARLSPKGYEELDRAHVIDPTNPQATGGRKVVWVHPAFANRRMYVRNDTAIVCVDLAK
ncbi:MAG: PQQ-like beta-propeller repeat protein [Gemmataceae bacterium]|nr:PQQ-like beta-propeller repeat protein [Gemmataceae bacterium]